LKPAGLSAGGMVGRGGLKGGLMVSGGFYSPPFEGGVRGGFIIN